MMAGNFPMGTMSTANFAVATQNNNLPLKALSTYIVQSGTQEARGRQLRHDAGRLQHQFAPGPGG